MCGIAGYIGKGSSNDLQKMAHALRHRGPDAQGVFEGQNFGLAHARLSIVDLSEAGSQPMTNTDSSVILVFNGEIYNFKELRNELMQDGYAFRGHSDTEVILALYDKYGEKVFSFIHGMFAIGIVDIKRNVLILARDRAGKKPLYWTQFDNQNFAFASELSALQAHPLWKQNKPKISQKSLVEYLVHDYVPTPATIFENVYKLEPATYVTVSLKDFSQIKRQYWNLSIQEEKRFNKQELDKLLQGAVKRRLIADVPIGIFLSGGLDSSAVAYYAAEQYAPKKIKTFSIGFNEKSFDESPYAYKVAKFLGTEHYHQVVTTQDCLSALKPIFSKLDEPLGDASIVPTYLVSEFARKHVTVALGGDGGDELFAGYPTFFAESFYMYGLSWLPQVVIKILGSALRKSTLLLPVSHTNFSFVFKVQKFLDGCVNSMSERHARYLASFSQREISSLVTFNVQDLAKDVYHSNEKYFTEFIKNSGSRTFSYALKLNALLYSYMSTYLLDGVLVKVDRATMMTSLEARSPILDTSIIEYAFSLPFKNKRRFLTLKWSFKKTMEGKLPHDIIYRKKKGFGMPVAEWLNGDMKFLVDKYLSRKYLEKQGLFNPGYVEKIVSEHQDHVYDHRKKLWNLLAFQLWFDNYTKKHEKN